MFMRAMQATCWLFASVVLWAGMPVSALQAKPVATLPDGVVATERALAEKDFDRALRISQSELRVHPADARLWTLRAMAYAGAGIPSSAVDAYRHALKLSPKFLPALEGVAQIEYQRGSPDAEAALRRVLAVQPADPTTHAMLAALRYRADDCTDAVAHFQQAQSILDANFIALSEYGVCLAKLNRMDEAIPVLQQALELQPASHRARYDLALALWKTNRGEDALHVLEPALQVGETNPPSSADPDSLVLAAEIYESRNDTPHAVELLRRAIATTPRDVQAYLSFAALCNDHASYQVGVDMLSLGVSQNPQAAQIYSARGVLYAQLGEFDKAMSDFAEADRIDPRLSFAGVAEGITETQVHDYPQALASFRKESLRHPGNAFNQYLLAETLNQHGVKPGSRDYAEELAAATRAVQLDPHLVVAHSLLASLYLNSGKTALAIQHCEAALRVDPANQEALYRLILALRKTDRKDEIPALTKKLVALRTAENKRRSETMRYQLVEAPTDAAARKVEPN